VAARLLMCRSPEPHAAGELLLCTLDEEVDILPPGADFASHPQWVSASAVPDDAAELSYWLGCRMPLTTALRLHLLACPCPLKRTRDIVDALRLLNNPSGEYSRARQGRGAKMHVVWDTAEASGCEVEPPRPVVDWAPGGELGASRY
jgi:hypothetical protein